VPALLLAHDLHPDTVETSITRAVSGIPVPLLSSRVARTP
jgi:hypothetical protein